MSFYIKANLDKIKHQLDEKNFLLSESYRLYLQRIVRGTSGNYKYEVIFSKAIATDGKIVSVNPVHPYLSRLTLPEKTLCISGQLMHELFHLIYTDFKTLAVAAKVYRAPFRKKILKEIFNIVEDSAVELFGTNYYTGTKSAIVALNQNALENIPEIEETKKTAPPLVVFLTACALYCILKKDVTHALDKEVRALFIKAKPIMDAARFREHSNGRLEAAKEIFLIALPLIEDAEAKGQEKDVEKEYIYTKSSEMSGNEEFLEPPSNILEDFQAEYENKTAGGDTQKGKAPSGEGEPPSSSLNLPENPKEKTDLEDIAEQLEKVKDDAAREIAEKDEQEKRNSKMKEFTQNIKYSDFHRKIKVRLIYDFPTRENDFFKYDILFAPLKSLAGNFAKNLGDIIRYNEDRKESGLYSGKISKGYLHRRDKKYFCRLKEKSNTANLAILILVDKSGSMGPKRIGPARDTCMLMYEVCQKLGIPLTILGHRAISGTDNVRHYRYVDFDSPNRKEKYNLLSMTACDNTREGVSLKYAGEYLKARPEEDKLLFVISDGQPYHRGSLSTYGGEEAEKDTKQVTKELSKAGIKVFGIAIGEGKNSIKNIYSSNYIDIPKIELLPTRLLDLMRRNIFK